jgi:hypothetical protein
MWSEMHAVAAATAEIRDALYISEFSTYTHQGYTGGELCRSVSAHPITMLEPIDAYRTASIHATSFRAELGARCAFCRALLSRWTRLRQWPWSG